MSSIQVATGRIVDVDTIEAWQITIEDIAHSLSNLCRFTGHTKSFYSVAEHSVLASKNVQQFLPKAEEWDSPIEYEAGVRAAQKMALLHDAHEAYVGDIARPMRGKFRGLVEYKNRIDEQIYMRFGLAMSQRWAKDIGEAVAAVDAALLSTEKEKVLSVNVPWPGELAKPLDIHIAMLLPHDAKAHFLCCFKSLWCEGVA